MQCFLKIHNLRHKICRLLFNLNFKSMTYHSQTNYQNPLIVSEYIYKNQYEQVRALKTSIFHNKNPRI